VNARNYARCLKKTVVESAEMGQQATLTVILLLLLLLLFA
jgi:uncharacterized integral membrane protein